ncbi:MAG: glutathione S-transferase C-terminal domain-containing protein [Verrucomicrobiota bacterium]
MVSQFPSEESRSGEFHRQEDAFREWILPESGAAFQAVGDRYHLYVSLACPWASRTVIARKLLGLERIIGLTVVDPLRDERGWAFREGDGFSRDPVNGFRFLAEAYSATDPEFDGRVTVPVLWDRETRRIVNNSEDDICRMFNDAFQPLRENKEIDWFPADIAEEHRELSAFIYDRVNNGVYRAGFAARQAPYDVAFRVLFAALDELEESLSRTRYLFPGRMVEADWRLFCTLVRFDAVYFGHFKCNLRRILDYPNLQGYLLDLYQYPGVSETVKIDQIKRHYYMTHEQINPSRIVPLGPLLDFARPPRRDHLP